MPINIKKTLLMLILCTRWYVLLTTDFITSTGVQLRASTLAQGSSRPCRRIKDTFTVNMCVVHTPVSKLASSSQAFLWVPPPSPSLSVNSFSAVCTGIVVPVKWAKLYRSACQGREMLIKVLHSPNLTFFIFLM